MDVSPFFMHHKFAVLDGTLLLNGSFNWTKNASQNNNENIMITNNPYVLMTLFIVLVLIVFCFKF